MKKILSLALGLAAIASVTSCADEDYSSKYNDPSKTSTVSCDKLFTGVVWNGRTYGMQTYWGLCTFELPQMGAYAQTASHLNDYDAYEGTGSYVSYDNSRWTNFYNDLSQYKLMRYTYDNLSEDQKVENQLYMDCATVWIYDELEKVVDLWGDVPFVNACNIQNTGDVADSKPSYDSATDLYKMMLNGATMTDAKGNNLTFEGLGTLYNRIKGATGGVTFTNQDILFGGDVQQWARYALGLRARMALRCSTQGELAEEGKAILKEMASALESFSGDCLTGFADPGTVAFSYNDGNGMNWGGGWNEWSRQFSRASEKMLEVLNADQNIQNDHGEVFPVHQPQADPRLAVMFDPSCDWKYRGTSTHDNWDEALAKWQSVATYRYYAVADSATFINNAYFMHPIMTEGEVFLTLAEAAQRGFISGSAEEYFKKGVNASIDVYYAENAKSAFRDPVVKPAQADVDAYIAKLWAEPDKLATICKQRWLHFSMLQPTQSYCEVRRTGYPSLDFVDYTSNTSANIPLPMDRLGYPQDEIDNNLDNMNAAKAKLKNSNEYYNAVFWAKPAGTWYNKIAAH